MSGEENLRLAMEILTAWHEGGDNVDLAREVIMRHVVDCGGDVEAEAAMFLDMLIGMGSLAGWFLVRIEKLSGTPASEILREFGQRIAQQP